jgi:phosphate transport system protein
MAEHTVTAFGQELADQESRIFEMGKLAVAQVGAAVQAIVGGDTAKAEEVVARDASLDVMDAEIEQAAARLIALRQPMAQDLRSVLAAMKISSNLERCGDLAKNIAKRTLIMVQADADSPARSGLQRMGRLAAQRLDEVMAAHRDHDVDAAVAVWRGDKEVDEQYDSLFRELLTYMMSDPRTITTSAHLLFVAKNLERIGDHATNIAEVVYYQFTGDPMPGTHRPKWDALKSEPLAD